MIFVLQQLPCSILLNVPQMKATGATLGAFTSMGVMGFVTRNLYIAITRDNALEENFDEVIANVALIVFSAFTLTLFCILVTATRPARTGDPSTHGVTAS